jgi:hypothetical protein
MDRPNPPNLRKYPKDNRPQLEYVDDWARIALGLLDSLEVKMPGGSSDYAVDIAWRYLATRLMTALTGIPAAPRGSHSSATTPRGHVSHARMSFELQHKTRACVAPNPRIDDHS